MPQNVAAEKRYGGEDIDITMLSLSTNSYSCVVRCMVTAAQREEENRAMTTVAAAWRRRKGATRTIDRRLAVAAWYPPCWRPRNVYQRRDAASTSLLRVYVMVVRRICCSDIPNRRHNIWATCCTSARGRRDEQPSINFPSRWRDAAMTDIGVYDINWHERRYFRRCIGGVLVCVAATYQYGGMLCGIA